ncbi:MAG TPA: hypothetical protein V6C76_11555 [Drouetiella sp.]
MKEMTLSAGQVACRLTLARKVQLQDLMISHFDVDQKLWHVDCAANDFRTSHLLRKHCFQRALDWLLTVVNTGKRGRRPVKKVKTSFRLTRFVQDYLETLARSMELDKSTVLAYLIIAAHAAYMDSIAGANREVMEEADEADANDDIMWVEAVKRQTYTGDLEQARKRDVMREFKKETEQTNDAIAAKIRADLEEEQAKKKQEQEDRMARLRAAESKADAKLKAKDAI